MSVLQFHWSGLTIVGRQAVDRWQKGLSRLIPRSCLLVVIVLCLILVGASPALAGLKDDRYDGEIFTLYAGNGSLVPPKFTLAEALKRDRPTLLVLYLDDSSDCKTYAAVVSQVQAFYGKAADLLPVRVDSIPPKKTYAATEPGHYYKGLVPQTILFDAAGKVVLDEAGVVPFETLDTKFREVFDLLPRTETLELKRRQVNEVTTELAR
ncbi:MAG: thylakoid membrane photosystem I accumulation factor [Leptolyngbya sp. BL-A-14]